MIDSRLETCVKHCHIHTVASPIAWAAVTSKVLYSALLRPKQSRSATEWHVLTGSHSFYLRPTRPYWLYSVSIHQMAPPYIAYYSIYRPLKDERSSWPSWLTHSERLTHISGHPSAAGRAWDRKIRRSKTTVPRNQLNHVHVPYRDRFWKPSRPTTQ